MLRSMSLYSLLQRHSALCTPLAACAAALAGSGLPACPHGSWHSSSATSPASAPADVSCTTRHITTSAAALIPQFGGYFRTGQAGTVLGADDEPRCSLSFSVCSKLLSKRCW